MRACGERHSVLEGMAMGEPSARTRTESGLNFTGKSVSTHTGRPLGVESGCRKRRKLAVGQKATSRCSILTEEASESAGMSRESSFVHSIGSFQSGYQCGVLRP